MNIKHNIEGLWKSLNIKQVQHSLWLAFVRIVLLDVRANFVRQLKIQI
jgi:hypothetical protein